MWNRDNRLFLIGYAVTLLVLVGDVFLTYLNISTLIEDLKVIQHTDAVQAELSDTLTNLLNAETGQRGYLLTGDERYLEPYQKAEPRLPKNVVRLDELLTAHPRSRKKLAILRDLVTKQMRDLEQSIEHRRASGEDDAISRTQTNEGKRRMEELRATLADLEREQREEFSRRSKRVAAEVNTTISTFAFTSALVLILLFAVTYFRRKVDRRRIENERKFRSLADSAPVMIWMSSVEGAATWFNKRWLDYSGCTMDEEIGNGWVTRIHPSDRDKCLAIRAASLTSRNVFTMEYRLRRRDLEYRWIFDSGTPVFNMDGRFEGFVGSCVDIHQLKESEEQRKLLFEKERIARLEADRANRLKDEFLATLSHELRTPLNAILGYAQLMKRGTISEAKRIEILDIIERNSRSQAQIIEDLLEMSRIISGRLRLELKYTELSKVIDAAIESVNPLAEAREVRFERIYQSIGCPVRGDVTRLQQVVWNLLTNAIKFSQRGSVVKISLASIGNKVELTITDKGIGIEEDFLPFVFDRFMQADSSSTRKHGGLGLGLAIVKQIVELHEGTVVAKSEGKNKGSSFVVVLPMAAIDASLDTTDSAATVQPAGAVGDVALNGLKILVVDDELDSREVVRNILELSGATTFAADCAESGFELLCKERPDILLSDIGMPQVDGYQFIRRVRGLSSELGGETPAIALTAFAREEDKQRALKSGYNLHLTKPVEPAFLISAIAKMRGLTT